MKGRLQSEPVEAEERGCGLAIGPAWSTNRLDQFAEPSQIACVNERAVAPNADAAQVSASKRHVVTLTI
jgi:hypothetical protein